MKHFGNALLSGSIDYDTTLQGMKTTLMKTHTSEAVSIADIQIKN